MKKGDTVRICVHGNPLVAERAKVVLISANQCSIALEFEDPPIFSKRLLYTGGMIGVNRETCKVTMLLSRVVLDGKPWGPWVEVTGGGHYEIEE